MRSLYGAWRNAGLLILKLFYFKSLIEENHTRTSLGSKLANFLQVTPSLGFLRILLFNAHSQITKIFQDMSIYELLLQCVSAHRFVFSIG